MRYFFWRKTPFIWDEVLNVWGILEGIQPSSIDFSFIAQAAVEKFSN